MAGVAGADTEAAALVTVGASAEAAAVEAAALVEFVRPASGDDGSRSGGEGGGGGGGEGGKPKMGCFWQPEKWQRRARQLR